MKLLVDMNLSPRWISMLTNSGFEAIHWSTRRKSQCAGRRDHGLCDHERLDRSHARFELQRDSGCYTRREPSVVQIRAENISPNAIGMPVVAALRQMESELKAGALLTIDPNRTRLRVLPLYVNKERT